MHSHYSKQAAFWLWHRLAASTQKIYSTGQKSFVDFVQLHPELTATSNGQYLSASLLVFVEWVSFLGIKALQPKTIKGYLSSVWSLHIEARLPFDNIESPTLQCVICGIKQYYDEKARKLKLPIIQEINTKLASMAGDCSTQKNTNLDSAYKTSWAGFFRCGEVTVGDKEKFNPAVHLFFSNSVSPSLRTVC
jgi:hypothetical protein